MSKYAPETKEEWSAEAARLRRVIGSLEDLVEDLYRELHVNESLILTYKAALAGAETEASA